MPKIIDDFWLDGERASDFGIVCQSYITFDPAEPRVETFEVEGRSGNVAVWDGSYKNVKGSVKCYCLGHDVARMMSKVNDWMLSNPGYRRLETLHDDQHFRRGRISKGPQLQNRIGLLNPFELEFDCDPRRFLKDGEREISITFDDVLVNPTGFVAKPLIKLVGHGKCAVRFGDVGVFDAPFLQLTAGAMTTAYIDVEEHECYDSAGNNLSSLLTGDLDLLQLPAGNTRVQYSVDDGSAGATSCTIIPRWCTL